MSTKSKFDTETHSLNDSFKKEKVFDDPPIKVDRDIEAGGELRQKPLNLMNRQLRARKQINDKLMKELNEIVANLEADRDALKENEQKVEQIAESVVKCVKQAAAACHEKLEAVTDICLAFKKEKQINDKFMKELNEIVANLEADHDALKENEQKVEHIAECVVKYVKQLHEKLEAVRGISLAYKKECEEVDVVHGAEADKLGHELAEDIQKLKQKLIADTKRYKLCRII